MRYILLTVMLLLSSCASSDERAEPVTSADEEEESNLFVSTVSDTFHGALDTIQTPFRDLGLVEEDIPDKLEEIVKNPYQKPDAPKCQIIMAEMEELDLILGSDSFVPGMSMKARSKENPGYMASGAKMASGFALNKLGSQVNILPLRGVVRRVSGADAHEKASNKAYQAGQLRRAYLRGMADSKGMKCDKIMIAAEKEEKPTEKPSKKYVIAVSAPEI